MFFTLVKKRHNEFHKENKLFVWVSLTYNIIGGLDISFIMCTLYVASATHVKSGASY